MKHHHHLFLALGALLSAGPFSTNAEAAPTVFNTGLNASGAPLASGTIDPHWQIVSSADPTAPGPDAYVIANTGFPIPPWLPQSALSQWIAPSANQSVGNAAGEYRYRTTFDLTGYNLAKLKLRLTIASDNEVPYVRLNGTLTSLTFTNGFQQFATEFLTSGFVPGVNTLEIGVTNNGAGPTGLRSELQFIDTDDAFTLHLELQPPNLVLNWSTAFGCCDVESTTDLSSGSWTTIPDAPSIVNGRFTLSLPRAEESMRFFRLKQRPPGPIGPVVLVNEPYGAGIMEYVTFDHPSCDIGTGCALVYPLDGTIDNYFDASETVYDSQCSISDGPVQYQWRFRYPPTIQSGRFYTNPAIIGTDTSHVTFPPNAMPALSGVDVGWRVILTITKNTPNGVVTREALFRFQYDSSELQCCP